MSDMPKTDEIIATVLKKSLDGAIAAGDFIAGQIPEVAKQLLIYQGIESGVWCILSTILMYVAYRSTRWSLALFQKDCEDWVPLSLIPCLLAPISVIMLLYNLSNFLEIILAPKLYLLEYVALLMKNHN